MTPTITNKSGNALGPRNRPSGHSAARAMVAAAVGSCAVIAAAALAPAPAAAAPESAVVFPFELLDSTQEGELFPKVNPAETKRLQLLADDLKTRLAGLSERFTILPTDAIAAEIKSAAPLNRCNGCEADLAKKAGAELGVLGVVQKFSDTLLSVNIQIVESATGTVRNTYSAGIQGNTDEAWLRGVSYIVRNRIASGEAKP